MIKKKLSIGLYSINGILVKRISTDCWAFHLNKPRFFQTLTECAEFIDERTEDAEEIR